MHCLLLSPMYLYLNISDYPPASLIDFLFPLSLLSLAMYSFHFSLHSYLYLPSLSLAILLLSFYSPLSHRLSLASLARSILLLFLSVLDSSRSPWLFFLSYLQPTPPTHSQPLTHGEVMSVVPFLHITHSANICSSSFSGSCILFWTLEDLHGHADMVNDIHANKAPIRIKILVKVGQGP